MNPVQFTPNDLEYINYFLKEASNNSDPLVITIDQTEGTITTVQGKSTRSYSVASGLLIVEVVR